MSWLPDADFVGTKFSITRPSIEKIGNQEERERVKQFLNRIWEVYSRYTAIQLSNLTHTDDSPWTVAWLGSNGARNTVIQNERIQKYFEAQRRQ